MKKTVLIILLAVLTAGALAVRADTTGYGYVSGDHQGTISREYEAIVVSKSVTLRSKASYSGTSLGSASNGDVLTVLDDSDRTWVRVRAKIKNKQMEGWVLRSYIVVQPLTLTLRKSNTPAYSAPSGSSKLVGSLPAFTNLEVLGTYDNYYVVSLRQASAFIKIGTDVWTSLEIESLFAGGSGTAITTRKTKTRSGPGESWAEGPTIASGETLTISWEEDGWYPALYDDQMLYVDSEDLRITQQIRGRSGSSSSGNQSQAASGQTITLPQSGGVTLVYWAQEENAGGDKPASGTLSLTQVTEQAVRALCQRYGLSRRDLKGYDLRYSYYSSAWYAYGSSDPFYVLSFWGGDDVGVVWTVSVNARNGAIFEASGPDDGNG
ncbi:MAG: SH3 domain-containing protein [Clostridia bacterium]|nr:SH3 domain-containing protein [Clostridia bacterium]